MGPNQILVLALASVPTMITVLIGILINNSRMTDLSARVMSLENKFDTRFDMLLDKVVDVDNRLTRMEAQRH